MSIDTRPGTGTRPLRGSAPVRSTLAPSQRTPSSHTTTAHTALIRAGVVETAGHDALVLERVTPSMLRVLLDGRTVGFVEHVGRVYVALAGEHYDRAVEVAQTLDVAHAARALA